MYVACSTLVSYFCQYFVAQIEQPIVHFAMSIIDHLGIYALRGMEKCKSDNTLATEFIFFDAKEYKGTKEAVNHCACMHASKIDFFFQAFLMAISSRNLNLMRCKICQRPVFFQH